MPDPRNEEERFVIDRELSLFDELVSLDPQARHELGTTLRQVSESFAEVPDGKTAAYVLGVLAHLLDPE